MFSKMFSINEVPKFFIFAPFLLTVAWLAGGCAVQAAQTSAPPISGGVSVVSAEALLTTPVGGLERTQAKTAVVPVAGQNFSRALRVTIGTSAQETNATQLSIPNSAPVEKGDVLLASFSVRGSGSSIPTSKKQAQVEFLFERGTAPWTKSSTLGVIAPRNPQTWKRVLVPFAAVEAYKPGEAMVSLRFAFGPQTVEVGGLSVLNFGKTKTVDELITLAAEKNLLGATQVTVRLGETKQTMLGFGGNFCQPRYGATEPMDAVGRYNLENLRVVHARVGLPLNSWTPEKGVFQDDKQAHAAFLAMQQLSRRKIPVTVSVWEGPLWMLGGPAEQSGRVLPPERYADCIEAVRQFLVTARDKYGVTADYFSFNEPDYGVNFKFTPAQMAEFIRQAGPRFGAAGLKTKFLVADTANGANFAEYARPLLEDKRIAPYLGPLAFHSWDALSVLDARYEEIAALGRKYKKPVWCTEAGHDAQLWQKSNPWASWQNALRTALAYEKTLRLSGASLMEYWTYQDNYPLVNKDGTLPYPVFQIIRQMEQALPPGSRVAAVTSTSDDLRVLAAAGAGKGQFSLLLINPIGAGTVTVSGLPIGADVSVVQSTDGSPRKTLPVRKRVGRDGRVTVPVPSRSVVTLLGVPVPRQHRADSE